MRIFSTDAVWDKNEQRWYEAYFIDKNEVSQEEYFIELEAEQVFDEDIIDENCLCCNCPDQCEEFNCTCGENTEVENMDYLLESATPCPCVNCKSARGEFTEEEELEIGVVEHYARYIEEIECDCGSELRNILLCLVQECMAMGYEDCKEEMRIFLDE